LLYLARRESARKLIRRPDFSVDIFARVRVFLPLSSRSPYVSLPLADARTSPSSFSRVDDQSRNSISRRRRPVRKTIRQPRRPLTYIRRSLRIDTSRHLSINRHGHIVRHTRSKIVSTVAFNSGRCRSGGERWNGNPNHIPFTEIPGEVFWKTRVVFFLTVISKFLARRKNETGGFRSRRINRKSPVIKYDLLVYERYTFFFFKKKNSSRPSRNVFVVFCQVLIVAFVVVRRKSLLEQKAAEVIARERAKIDRIISP